MPRPGNLPEDPAVVLAKAQAAAEQLEIRKREKIARNKISTMFPDEGPYRRELYPKQMEFFKAGKLFKERLFAAGNRLGKSEAGCFELVCHLTGNYPHWWEGRRFDKPIEAWACGTNSETTRDIVQHKLLGPLDRHGTGMIPADLIEKVIPRRGGIAGSIETIYVKHVTGGVSVVGLKSYEQGRESFEGTAKDVAWCIAEGELIQMADGSLKPIEKVKVGDSVLSLDKTGNPVGRRVLATVDQGDKLCMQISPKFGTPILCTHDHNVYRGYGLKDKVPALEADRIAQIIPGWWPDKTKDRSDAWYIWAALVIAEGHVAGKKVTNGAIEVMEEAVRILPPEARVRRKNFAEHQHHVPDWHLYWDEFWGEWPKNQLSATKEIPNWIFKSSKDKVALFLRWLYMGDGWAHHHGVWYATTSRRLASQLSILLNRMGIRSNISVRKSVTKTWREQYWVGISRSSEVVAFIDTIGIVGKAEAVASVWAEATRRTESKKLRARHMVIHGNCDPKYELRNVRQRVKTSLIRSTEDIGHKRVFDITVEGEHRFLCGTSLVSNCDEEPPADVYTEILFRTATTRGIIYTTFTPLKGMSAVVMGFFEPENPVEAAKYKFYVQAGWKHVPHIPEEEKAALLATTPPYQIKARTEGEPALGSGAVYPISEAEITANLVVIPMSWPRVYALDVGFSRTAALWAAKDPATGRVYVYSEHYGAMGEPPTHAHAIKERGEWIPGVIDPACQGGSQIDGRKLIDLYRKLGLKLSMADNDVETGIKKVWNMLVDGQLKILPCCENFFREFRNYHRVESRDGNNTGKIAKTNDHLVDCLRYLISSGLQRMLCPPRPLTRYPSQPPSGERSWMS
jgi:phage terminase large subunit-like protein